MSAIPGFAGWTDDIKSRAEVVTEAGIPDAWTPEHVQARLVEAFDILARSGTRVGPRQHGNGWPAMVHEFADLVDAQARAIAEKEKQQDRAARPTADELSRMNEALAWPLHHLEGRPLQSDALMLWAYATALDRDMAAMLHQRKKRATALADEMARRHNAPPHIHQGRVMDTRDPEIIAKALSRRAIAGVVAEIFNAEMEAAAPHARADMRRQAQAAFRAQCADSGCLPLVVKPHEAMPGRCLSRTNLDRQRKVAAAAVASTLRRAGVTVR